MREIRCVSRTTVYNFCLSLSLSPQTPSAVLPTAGHIPVLLFVCFTHTRMSSAVDCLFFGLFVTLYLCLYLCLCLCLTRDDLEMRFRAHVHVCMYIEADIELSRLHIAWQCTCT